MKGSGYRKPGPQMGVLDPGSGESHAFENGPPRPSDPLPGTEACCAAPEAQAVMGN